MHECYCNKNRKTYDRITNVHNVLHKFIQSILNYKSPLPRKIAEYLHFYPLLRWQGLHRRRQF